MVTSEVVDEYKCRYLGENTRTQSTSPPRLRPRMLAIVAATFFFEITALLVGIIPAGGAVNVVDLTDWAVFSAVRVDFVDLLERLPQVAVRENRVRIDQLGQLGSKCLACTIVMELSQVPSGEHESCNRMKWQQKPGLKISNTMRSERTLGIDVDSGII